MYIFVSCFTVNSSLLGLQIVFFLSQIVLLYAMKIAFFDFSYFLSWIDATVTVTVYFCKLYTTANSESSQTKDKYKDDLYHSLVPPSRFSLVS
jgi:hypothetical protein